MLYRREAGDTLVEVVFASAILAVVLVTAFNIANLSYKLGMQARERTQAASLLQEQAERLTAYRDQQSASPVAPPLPASFIPGSFPAGDRYIAADLTSTATVGCGHQEVSPYGLFCVKYTRLSPIDDPIYGKVRINIHVQWTSAIGGGLNTSDLQIVLVDRRMQKKDCSVVESCAL